MTVLLSVVLVQSESKLVLDLAHTVRAILAGRSVGIQAKAVSHTADCA